MAMLAPGHLKAKKPEQIKWLLTFAHWRSRKGRVLPRRIAILKLNGDSLC
jgi:signal recognition particle subunit SEC65